MLPGNALFTTIVVGLKFYSKLISSFKNTVVYKLLFKMSVFSVSLKH